MRYKNDICMIAALLLPLLSFVDPRLLIYDVVIAGGDATSHYQTAKYLKENLLSNLSISGWFNGSFCGFPILEHYFPVPFLLISFLSFVLPLGTAFNIVYVMSIYLMPLSVFLFIRQITNSRLSAFLAGLFSIAFLLNDGNTMWGGNIYSTFAGEFCYSISLCLAILYLGSLWRCIYNRTSILLPSILLTLTGMSHAYPLFLAILASTFFLLDRNPLCNLAKISAINIISFLLMGFWLIPLLANIQNTVTFAHVWYFADIKTFLKEFSPKELMPNFVIGLVLGTFCGLNTDYLKKHSGFLLYIVLCGLLLYLHAHYIKQPVVRFLPLIQLFLAIFPALVIGQIIQGFKFKYSTVALTYFIAFMWFEHNMGNAVNWSHYSLTGLENKPYYRDFLDLCNFIKGNESMPRIAWEHTVTNELLGTARIHEVLPMFSGRNTLEGLYMQASMTSPFVYYVQSQLTNTPSTPFPQFIYSRLDLDSAYDRLRLLNVSHFVAVSSKVKDVMKDSMYYRHVKDFGILSLYEVIADRHSYVDILKNFEVSTSTKDKLGISFEWFRTGDLKKPILFMSKKEYDNFKIKNKKNLLSLNEIPIDMKISGGSIKITGAEVGVPLLIKLSYHPNWRAKGAENIYHCSPNFMVIIPSSTDVELYFARGMSFYLGLGFSFLGLVLLIASKKISKICLPPLPLKRQVYLLIGGILALALLAGFLFPPRPPEILLIRATRFMSKGEYDKAFGELEKIIERYPTHGVYPHALLYLALYHEIKQDYANAIEAITKVMNDFPEFGDKGYMAHKLGDLYKAAQDPCSSLYWYNQARIMNMDIPSEVVEILESECR